MMVCAVTATLTACGGGGENNESATNSSAANTGSSVATGTGSPGQCADGTMTQSAGLQGACSGHGGLATAEGLYTGIGSTGRAGTGIIFDDGSYYFLYSAQNNPSIIAGAVVGFGTSSNGSFASTNARDINLEGLGLLSGTVSGSYAYKKSFSGFATYPALNQTVTVTGSYSAEYEVTPTLAAVAGTYSGRVGHPRGAESATITVTSSGAISGRGSSGCVVTGNLTPRVKGNAYTTRITFGGAPCLLPGATLTGASYFDRTTKRLYAVGLTSARDNGMIFAGSKP